MNRVRQPRGGRHPARPPYRSPGPRRGFGRRLVPFAAALGAAALYVYARARDAERAAPPIGRFIDVNGVRLHYLERGSGAPVLLLHGAGLLAEDFDVSGLVNLVSAQFRAIAFDRPGYGYSERPRTTIWTPDAQAELLIRALDRLGVEQPIVVGHSWGALVALALALREPSRARALVLVSGYFFPTLRQDVFWLSPPAIPILGDAMRYTISPVLSRLLWRSFVERLFAPKPVPPRFIAAFPRELTLRPEQIRAAAADAALLLPAAAAMEPRYRDLTVPAVIVTGSDDRYVDVDRQSARLHAEVPGSELVTVAGAGHMVHYTAPDRVFEAVERAMQRASPLPNAGTPP